MHFSTPPPHPNDTRLSTNEYNDLLGILLPLRYPSNIIGGTPGRRCWGHIYYRCNTRLILCLSVGAKENVTRAAIEVYTVIWLKLVLNDGAPWPW